MNLSSTFSSFMVTVSFEHFISEVSIKGAESISRIGSSLVSGVIWRGSAEG
jgi:hypothetical protein